MTVHVDWITGDTITAVRLNYGGFLAGDVKLTARSAVPNGWLACDGAAISRTTYADLFAAIGTAYGVGDGSTTFNVPNFLGRAVIGSGSGSGLTARSRGDSSGSETHALTTSELAAHSHSHTHDTIGTHTHDINLGTDNTTAGNLAARVSTGATTTPSVAGGGHTHAADATSTGSGTAHNNMQPFGVATYIIKT